MTLDQLVIEAVRIADALFAADEAGKNEVQTLLEDRRDLIESMASHLQAESCQGALLQVALAWQAVDTMRSWLPEEPHPHRAIEAHDQLQRMLHSLRRFIEKLGGEPMHPRVSGFYMLASNNPLAMVDEALAAVDVGEARP